jgi:hypothetical protein
MQSRFPRSRLVVLGAFFVLVALGGCTKTSKVEGTITYKNAPLEGASISLVDNNGTIVATGQSDASGKFTLLTPQFKEAIPAGDYKAVVTKSKVIGDGAPMMVDGKYTPEAMKAMKAGGKDIGKNLLPAKFAAADSTTLKVKVPPDGPIALNLDS